MHWTKLYPDMQSGHVEGRFDARSIELEKVRYGRQVLVLDEPRATINPGDSYLTGRYMGPMILVCRTKKLDWIIPVRGYSYDVSECRRIKEIYRG